MSQSVGRIQRPIGHDDLIRSFLDRWIQLAPVIPGSQNSNNIFLFASRAGH